MSERLGSIAPAAGPEIDVTRYRHSSSHCLLFFGLGSSLCLGHCGGRFDCHPSSAALAMSAADMSRGTHHELQFIPLRLQLFSSEQPDDPVPVPEH